MTASKPQDKSLRIAVVGAGPGGLGAAIAFSQLPFVDLQVYEQARELREIGAGISINENTWRLLRIFGAAEHMTNFYRKRDDTVIEMEQRNGQTGELLRRRYQKDNPNRDGPPHSRIERYKLQQALLKQVPPGLIQLRKRLIRVEETAQGLSLHFEDGTVAENIDLLVGADGLRSVVRQFAFPDHKVKYTGKVAYRVLIPQSKVAHIEGIPDAAVFWNTLSTHVFTCPLDDGLFEIATRALESEEHGNKVSWGQEATKEQVVKHYAEYHPTVRAIIDAPDSWLQFALFGGPRLESVITKGRIALIGDASHPLSGAFGSGAAFALEDAYTLKEALDYAHRRSKPLSYALELYDTTRSPHYKKLYEVLDFYAANVREVDAQQPPLSTDEKIATRVEKNWDGGSSSWIYKYDITKVWKERVAEEDANDRTEAEIIDLRELSAALPAVAASTAITA